MTLAEFAAVSIACWLALVEAVAYLSDAVGFGISPFAVLIVSLLITAFVTATIVLNDRAEPSRGTPVLNDAAWLAVVLAVFGLLLRFAWPSLLPPGSGPDLTHHLLLIDYIERHWHLVHDLGLDGAMGEMAHYTPGAHVLAVLVGAWSGTDGLRAVYPLMAACAALTAGFVYLISLRRSTVPAAMASVALVLLPRAYFIDAFAHDSYVAQVVSALFAVAIWWATVAWDETPSVSSAALVSIFAVGAFLAWPMWIGPALLAFGLVVLLRREIPLVVRMRHLAIAGVPLLIVAAIHAKGRLGWLAIVRTSGAVLHPALGDVGWIFALLAVAGLALRARERRVRATAMLTFAIALQTAALYVMAKSNGADTPYMAFKMGYLAIYPLAAFGGLAVAIPGSTGSTRSTGSTGSGSTGSLVQGFIAVVLLIVAVRPLVSGPKPIPVVSRDFYEAGKWTRANVGSACVDYLVADANTAYWLHLAVLGNPRSTARTAEVDHHQLRTELAKWIPAEGNPYAIADLTLLPDEIRNRVEIVKTFGRAAVIRRPGRTCEP